MSTDRSYRVFVSYTGEDLEAHADIVSDMIRRLNSDSERSWIAIDHKFWSPTGRPSVQECMEQVERCQILIVLVAFRYGWVPSRDERGDGETSITRMEVERARAAGLEVIPFLVEDNTQWNVGQMEGLNDPVAQGRLLRFKAELRRSLAGFFDTPRSLEAPIVLALNKAADRIERSRGVPKHESTLPGQATDADIVVPSYFDPAHPPSLEERLSTQLPKRILALGSAGVRAAITLGYLERLEQALGARYGDPDFRLSSYFDLIGAGGASAIIAAELARGRSVAEARHTFVNAVRAMLSSRSLLALASGARYRPNKTLAVLGESFGDMALASPQIETGLCVILTRLDTGEIYSLTNHPALASPDRGHLPLSAVLLSSLATPFVLPPVELRLGGDIGSFTSGELSVGPDPALHLFLVATGPSFPFRWRTGQRRIFLTSIGTGNPPIVKRDVGGGSISSVTSTVSSLVAGLKEQSELVLAALTHEDTSAPTAARPNAAVARSSSPILTYRRLDVELSAAALTAIGLPDLASQLDSLIRVDAESQLENLLEIGRRCGTRDIDEDFLSASFDVRPRPSEGH